MIEFEQRSFAWDDVSRETMAKLECFAALLRDENQRQNLISQSSEASLFERHIVDSAQLVAFARNTVGPWIDLGSGAGLPGVVTALLTGAPTFLVEARKLRADWLGRVVAALELRDVTVVLDRVERVRLPIAGVITARAFAPLAKLLGSASHLSDAQTLWLLPKGKHAAEELASVTASWQGRFRLEPSITDSASRIIVASHVRPRRAYR